MLVKILVSVQGVDIQDLLKDYWLIFVIAQIDFMVVQVIGANVEISLFLIFKFNNYIIKKIHTYVCMNIHIIIYIFITYKKHVL